MLKESDTLEHIVKSLNDTYGLELTDEYKIEIDNMRKRIVEDESLMTYFNKENLCNDV